MNRDLFALVFSELSDFSKREYEDLFVHRLPLIMFESALNSIQKSVQEQDIADIHEALSQADSKSWKNPEIYPHLVRLHQSNEDDIPWHLAALKVHLKGVDASILTIPSGQFLRLYDSRPMVYKSLNLDTMEVPGIVCTNSFSKELLVYRPYPGLFWDIAGTLYKGRDETIAVDQLSDITSRGLSILENYSEDLFNGFLQSISVIGFTSDEYIVTKSYSMRHSYFGGIFSSICESSNLVENLIHEYYHCVLWKWWLLEPPRDLPSQNVCMKSPFTGKVKSVAVMMHALMIYISVTDFYRWYQSRYGTSETDSDCLRLERIGEETRKLIEALYKKLKGRPACLKFISILDDIYRLSVSHR